MYSDRAIFNAGRERILPDSCVELVIHFRDPFRTYFADGTSALQPHGFVVGQMKRFVEIEPAGRMGLIAVRFRARGDRFLRCSNQAAYPPQQKNPNGETHEDLGLIGYDRAQ